MKRNKTILLLAAMVVTFMLSCISVSAATKDTRWVDAYLAKAAEMNKESNKQKKNRFYQSYKYQLIYFNDDKVPELLVGKSGYFVSMYTFYNGKIRTLMDHMGYGVAGNHGYEYIPKKNIWKNVNADYAGAVNYVTYQKMSKGKLVKCYKKPLVFRYWIDKNKNGQIESKEVMKKPYYYYGNTKITKKKFDSYGKKGNYILLNPKYSYSQIKTQLNSFKLAK